MSLKPRTIIVLVYDTDVDNTGTLKKNIEFLNKQANIKSVICIPQVKSLEDELVRSCNIKSPLEITNSSTLTDFKKDFNHCTNLAKRLKDCAFDITKIWIQNPKNRFSEFGNHSERIKLKINK